MSNTTYPMCWNLTEDGAINCTPSGPLRPGWYAPLDRVHRVTLTFTLVYMMFAMGCTVQVSEVIRYLKRPWPILVGVLCQFGIFPALAFAMVVAFRMETLYALGCVILSCSPGGGSSNLLTYWVDGNVSLSIVMTVTSTVLAFVLMPLNIFIYTRLWVSELAESAITGSPFTVIPYDKIFIALAQTLGPVIVGVLIRKWSVKVAEILAKIGSILGIVLIWILIAMQAFLYKWHKQRMWQMWVASIVLPGVGYACGFCMSKLLCQPKPIPRTVAFETGCQNIAVAMSVIALSFTNDVVKKVIMFPTLYSVFAQVVAFVPISIYCVYKWLNPLKGEPEIQGKASAHYPLAEVVENPDGNSKNLDDNDIKVDLAES